MLFVFPTTTAALAQPREASYEFALDGPNRFVAREGESVELGAEYRCLLSESGNIAGRLAFADGCRGSGRPTGNEIRWSLGVTVPQVRSLDLTVLGDACVDAPIGVFFEDAIAEATPGLGVIEAEVPEGAYGRLDLVVRLRSRGLASGVQGWSLSGAVTDGDVTVVAATMIGTAARPESDEELGRTESLFLRCDVDRNARNDISDALWILDEQFYGGARTACARAADCNGDLDVDVDIADAAYLLQFLFRAGPAPAGQWPQCECVRRSFCDAPSLDCP